MQQVDTITTEKVPYWTFEGTVWSAKLQAKPDTENIHPPFFALSWAIISPSGIPSIPNISISMFSLPVVALGTRETVSLWTCEQWMAKPGAEKSFLWQMWHLKCLAFWWNMRTLSSSNSRLQYLRACAKENQKKQETKLKSTHPQIDKYIDYYTSTLVKAKDTSTMASWASFSFFPWLTVQLGREL